MNASQANPHKWKKYSLSDADTSDRTNTAAAFEFLREIEERKRNEAVTEGDVMDTSEQDGVNNKIVFKQRRRADLLATKFNQSVSLKARLGDTSTEDGVEKAVLKGSKVVMPEYVFGQKVAAKEKRVKKRSEAENNTHNKLKLNHLFDEEEDDE